MFMKNKKGFTLIELLVVVAIIGLLASVVVASLKSARDKGADASVKENIGTIRSQAEIYYNNNSNKYGTNTTAIIVSGSAGTACNPNNGMFNDTTIKNALAQVANQIDKTSSMICALGVNGQSWAVYVSKLKGVSTPPTSWCVDSNGSAKASIINLATNLCS